MRGWVVVRSGWPVDVPVFGAWACGGKVACVVRVRVCACVRARVRARVRACGRCVGYVITLHCLLCTGSVEKPKEAFLSEHVLTPVSF